MLDQEAFLQDMKVIFYPIYSNILLSFASG